MAEDWAPRQFYQADREQRIVTALGALDGYVAAAIADRGYPSLAVRVEIGGHVWERFHGSDEGSKSVDANSVFRIGSVSKTFVALVTMALRDEGVLVLDRPAQDYLPQLASVVYPTATSPLITVRQLLTHTHLGSTQHRCVSLRQCHPSAVARPSLRPA